MRKISIALLPFFLLACTHDPVNNSTNQINGFAPVYAVATDIAKITIQPARKTEQAGKIYAIGNYIFQNDINKGIHIINNRDKKNPVKIAFIQLPFSTEIAVKGNFLYSNNLSDLVIFDITDISKPALVKRIVNAFPPANQTYPPISNGSFECADASKGIVVGWELKMLTNPKCRR